MTQLFREFDVENFEVIQEKLVPYIIEKHPKLMQFWNNVNQDELFLIVPELLDAIISITGQKPLKTYILVVPYAPAEILNKRLGANSLHKDTSTEICRLNWPVLNSSSIETKIFESTAEPTKLLLDTGQTYLRFNESDCQEIGNYRQTKPTILNVHNIHGLYRVENSPLPRYVLSFNFDQPIEHLLN